MTTRSEEGGDGSPKHAESSACPTSNPRPSYSFVEYYGPNASYCGYCKQSEDQNEVKGRRTYDMNSYHLTASDYQDMLDRGWRRSGSYCYNPVNQTTCCPNYSIVCKVDDFILTRSHRQCIMALNSYLLNGDTKFKSNGLYSPSEKHDNSTTIPQNKQIKTFAELQKSSKAKDRRFVKACERKMSLHGLGVDDAIKAVQERWSKRRQPILSLEDFLYPKKHEAVGWFKVEPKHKLVIKMSHVNSQESMDMREAEHAIIVRYQKDIHNETRKEWTMSRYCDFLVESPIIVEPLTNLDYLVEPKDDKRDLHDSDRLSLDVNKECPAKPYLLVRPPQLPTAYGTYHCSYHLDGQLIAVGVLDVLPKCITTVYFFYDPQFGFLNLGIYSAMVEISMTRQLNSHTIDRSLSSTKDYYLGFYVPECKKMHYKTRFKPSYLLCSKTFKYVPTEVCMAKLGDKKYVDFADEEEEEGKEGEEGQHDGNSEIQLVQLLEIPVHSPVESGDLKLINYLRWLEKNLGSEYADLMVNGYLISYARLIGAQLLSRLHLKIEVVHRTLKERHKRIRETRVKQETNGQEARRLA